MFKKSNVTDPTFRSQSKLSSRAWPNNFRRLYLVYYSGSNLGGGKGLKYETTPLSFFFSNIFYNPNLSPIRKWK